MSIMTNKALFFSFVRYYLFGPTCLHLKHEVYLLISLSILTTASLASFYRHSFGTKTGDYQVILTTTLWLSRHLVFRYIVTSNSRLSFILSRYCAAGQYFDIPSRNAILSHTGGSASNSLADYHPSVITMLGSGASSSGSSSHHNKLENSPFLHCYVIIPMVRLWNWISYLTSSVTSSLRRLLSWQGSSSVSGLMDYHGFEDSSFGGGGERRGGRRGNQSTGSHSRAPIYSSTLYRKLGRLMDWVPPTQMCMAVLVGWICLTGLLFFPTNSATVRRSGIENEVGWNSPDRMGRNSQNNINVGPTSQPINPHNNMPLTNWGNGPGGMGIVNSMGGPFHNSSPGIWRFLFCIASAGTLASLLFYGRVFLPIPDLTAGTNVFKAVRAEAKHLSNSNKTPKTKKDAPWAEHYKSITLENRLRLFCKVTLIRILENIFLCALLPQTSFTCKVTGHCESGSLLWEKPTGIGGDMSEVGATMFRSIISVDHLSIFAISSTVAVVTTLLLLAQIVTLDKTYLAIMGHIGGELAGPNGGDVNNSSTDSGTAGNRTYASRRYKKGGGGADVHNYKDTLSSSQTASDGQNIDLYLRLAHLVFSSELGHTSTSTVICIANKIYAYHLLTIFLLILIYYFMGYNAVGLQLAFLATFIAAYGTIHVGLMDYGELNHIVKDISVPLDKSKRVSKNNNQGDIKNNPDSSVEN